jgi:hypothetical protein
VRPQNFLRRYAIYPATYKNNSPPDIVAAMIKLTLVAGGGNPIQRTFFQRVVILGAEESSGVDFPLPLPLGQHESVMLIDEGTHITLTNLTFDQLVQVDGRAVVSQIVQSGQTIDIGGVIIAFEGVAEYAEGSSLHQAELAEAGSLDLNFELPDGPLTEEQIDRWIRELEGEESVLPSRAQPVAKERRQWRPRFRKGNKRPRTKVSRKLYVSSSFVALVLVIGATMTNVLLTLQRTNQATLRAAGQELADLSMALVHAQLTGDLPPVVEGLASSFLAPHLKALFPEWQETGSSRVSQLRLYSTRDFSRFLVVADPNTSSFWGRLAPLPLLALSSDELIIRMGHERDNLRQLLGWSRVLDGIDASQIDSLLNRMEPLPFSQLDTGAIADGWFAPEGIDSTTAAYLASAPRFYRLSESPSPHMLKIPGLILYCSEGVSPTELAASLFETCDGHCSVGQVSLMDGQLVGARYLGEVVLASNTDRQEEPPINSLASHVRSEIEHLAAQRLARLQPLTYQVIDLVRSHLDRPSLSLSLTLGMLTDELLAQEQKVRADLDRAIADLRLICEVNGSIEATQALTATLEEHHLDQIETGVPLLNEASDFAQLQEIATQWIALAHMPTDLLSRYTVKVAEQMLDEAEEGQRKMANSDLDQLERIVRLFGCQADNCWFDLIVRCDQIIAEQSQPLPASLIQEECQPIEELSLPPPLPVQQMPQKQPKRGFFGRRQTKP